MAKELGRSEIAIRTKFYYEIDERENKRGYMQKTIRITNKNYKKADKCPICGGRRINKVKTFINQNCVDVNYCLNCFHEFTGDGYILKPAWER